MLRNRLPFGLFTFVSDRNLVLDRHYSLELERTDQPGVRPASLEVGRAVDSGIGRAEEREVIREQVLHGLPIACLVGAVDVTSELYAVLAGHWAPSVRFQSV